MDDVTRVKNAVDIVGLINEYVPLKKAGRNFSANCPFHQEKTPSFIVSPERQIWHCFGCSRGGDVFTFLMEYEHIEFFEALRVLATRAGVTLTGKLHAITSSKKERLYAINKVASNFYHYILTTHRAGTSALAYLRQRGVNEGAIKTYKIGFAPESRNSLSVYLQKKGFLPEDIIACGLSIQRGRLLTDFFFGRVMFPLIDHRDNVVGFSGRILNDTGTGPKYINTKDTLIYHKGTHFFGINVAKESMRKAESVLLVEGEFDVISCFQEGIGNVIALKGTALTEQQGALLARFVRKVILCFDNDNAGREALIRSLPFLEKYGLLVSMVPLSASKDPDEAIKTDASAFKQAFKHALPVYDFLLEDALQRYSKDTAEGKHAMTNLLLPLFAKIQNQIVKEHYLRKLASTLNTSIESVEKEFERYQEKASPMPSLVNSVPKRSREETLKEYLLALILQADEPQSELAQSRFLADLFSKTDAYGRLFHQLLDYSKQSKKFSLVEFDNFLPTELLPVYNACMLRPLASFTDRQAYRKEVTRVCKELFILLIRSKLRMLSEEIRRKEEMSEDAKELHEQYNALLKKLPSK
jgi:DNA primase